MFLTNLATFLSFGKKSSTSSYQSRLYHNHENNTPIHRQYFSITLILSILLLLLPTGKTANKSTTQLPEFLNTESMYYVSMLQDDGAKTQDKSWRFCSNMSGELISFETPFEVADLIYHLDPQDINKDCTLPVWTAGHFHKTTKSWKWPRGDDINNWCPGYPIAMGTEKDVHLALHVSKLCTAISCNQTYNWCLMNMDCDELLPFICEKRSAPYDANPNTFGLNVKMIPPEG